MNRQKALTYVHRSAQHNHMGTGRWQTAGGKIDKIIKMERFWAHLPLFRAENGKKQPKMLKSVNLSSHV